MKETDEQREYRLNISDAIKMRNEQQQQRNGKGTFHKRTLEHDAVVTQMPYLNRHDRRKQKKLLKRKSK